MKRTEKFLKQAKLVPYTKEELTLLLDLIESSQISFPTAWDRSADIADIWELSGSLREYILYNGIMVDGTEKKLNFMQYLLVYFRKIFLFLTCVPLKDLPLYIERKPLNTFCLWRMQLHR